MPLTALHVPALIRRARSVARCGLWAAVGALVLALGGCGTATPFGGGFNTDSLPQKGRRTICVVSALGNIFGVDSLGLTMFGSDHTNVPVDSWQIDDYVTSRIAELLGTRFNIHRISAPANAFASLEQSGALFRNLKSERADILRKLVLGERCDYNLLVLRSTSTVGTTNQQVKGFGVVRSGDGVIIDNVHLYALASIVLYENFSFKILAEQNLEGPGGLFKALSGPHRKLESSAWPKPPSAADNANFKAGVLSLLDAALVTSVPEIANIN